MRTRWDLLPRRAKRPGMLANGLPPGLYGSTLAASLVRDAISGADSLDVVTIGDSNAGFSLDGTGGGGGGWSRGWYRALNALGANTYASMLMPTMVAGSVNTATQLYKDDDSTIGGMTSWFSNTPAPYGNVVRGTASGPTALTNKVVPATSFTPYGLTNWNYSFIANGNSAQTFAQPNGTYPGGAAPNPPLQSWTQPGTAVKYRTIYATQSDQTSTSTRARFNPTAYRVDAGNYIALATKAQDTYNASANVLQTTDLDFTMPSSPANQAVIVGWNYIGMAYGPCSVMWDCVYRVRKGIAVNNLHYGSGQSASTISDVITGANGADRTFVASYFAQLRQRQIDAGGSGRVIVWINYGINSPESPSVWTSKTQNAINFLCSAWVAAGGSANQFAVVVSVTHPLNTFGAATEAALAANRAAANVWAVNIPQTTVVDLSQMFTAAEMTANGYYAGPGSGPSVNNEAHLSQAGYYNIALKFCRLLASV